MLNVDSLVTVKIIRKHIYSIFTCKRCILTKNSFVGNIYRLMIEQKAHILPIREGCV